MSNEFPLDDYHDGPLTPSTHGALVNEERTHEAGVAHGRWIERQSLHKKVLARAAKVTDFSVASALRQLAELVERGEL